MTKFLHLQLALSWLTRPIYGGIGHILMYHRVIPQLPKRVPGQARLEVTPGQLEETIQFFSRRNYDFLSLDQLSTRLAEGRRRNRFVVFTFDDGYLDNLIHAYPIFKQHQVPFAIYIAASFPERKAVLWWYLLDELILNREKLILDLPDGHLELDCSTTEQKIAASRTLRGKIKYAAHDRYQDIIEAIFSPYGIDLMHKTEELALSWEQIGELSRDPLVTIGSHSMHHYTLKNQPEAVAREEIEAARTLISQKLNLPVEHFAYPYGEKKEADEREFALVRQLGFKTAVTTRFASIFPAHLQHTECLPRFDMPSLSTQEKLVLAVNGFASLRRNRLRRVVCG